MLDGHSPAVPLSDAAVDGSKPASTKNSANPGHSLLKGESYFNLTIQNCKVTKLQLHVQLHIQSSTKLPIQPLKVSSIHFVFPLTAARACDWEVCPVCPVCLHPDVVYRQWEQQRAGRRLESNWRTDWADRGTLHSDSAGREMRNVHPDTNTGTEAGNIMYIHCRHVFNQFLVITSYSWEPFIFWFLNGSAFFS